jgi:hypothetical protein
MQRQLGLKRFLFCLIEGKVARVECMMPEQKVGEQDMLVGNLTGKTNAPGAWGKMAGTPQIRFAMKSISPLIPGPQRIPVRSGPFANAPLHLLGHPRVGELPLPTLIR